MPPPSAWSSRSASAPPPDAAGRHRPARGGVSSPPRDSPEATTHPHVRGRPAFWGQSSIGEPQSIHGILSGTVRSSMAPTLLCHAPRCQRPPTERRSRRGPTERRPGLGRSRCPSGVIGHNVPHSVFRGEPGRFASRCTLCQRPAKRSRPAKPDEFRQRGFGSRTGHHASILLAHATFHCVFPVAFPPRSRATLGHFPIVLVPPIGAALVMKDPHFLEDLVDSVGAN